MRYNIQGAPQAKILWSAPSKSRFYYLFGLLELLPGHLRRSILRILVLNPTHEISWSRSGFFSLRGRILRAGPLGPLCFLVFVSSPPPSALQVPGRPLNERSKTLRPGPSVFDLSVSARSLAGSEGPGPLNRKQKQACFSAVTMPLQQQHVHVTC